MKTEWDVEAAIATYNVDGWGEGYFTVNSTGNVDGPTVCRKTAVRSTSWKSSTKRVTAVLSFPLVIRFQDLLRHRVESINRAFQERDR